MQHSDLTNIITVGCVAALGIIGIIFGSPDTKMIGVAAVSGLVGFLSGKATDAIPWDEFWNKHLTKSDWLERADHWEDIHVIHDR